MPLLLPLIAAETWGLVVLGTWLVFRFHPSNSPFSNTASES